MLPGEFYKQRLTALQIDLNLLHKKRSTLAWLRFGAITGIAAVWYFLIPYGLLYVIFPGLILLLLFTRLVFADLKNKSFIKHHKYLIAINEDELKALAHSYYHFADGSEYIPKEHFYANDLDIFGHASLYQYINRTSSEMGSSTLADWLSNPAKAGTVIERQHAVKELATQTVWRQQLQAFGAAEQIKKDTQNRLQNWFAEEDRFINNKFWLLMRYLVPAVILTVIALNITDVLNNYIRNYCLLASTLFAFYISKKVTPLHQQVSKMTDELEVLTGSIQLIEQSEFKSIFLQDLQKQFKQDHGMASTQLNNLKKILERLDLRFNFVVFIPLDILLQWDLQQVIALEKWKQHNHKNVIAWFTALGEFEAVNSLSTLYFNHPGWCFPILKEDHFFIEGREIGHPLIQAEKCVNNPVKINNTAELMLVTGSNMAGKSTYLRSIGINTVLAMGGAPVCAEYFCLSPVQIISSMRIADNLEESTSTFYAELKKLKTIIDKVNNNEKVFILLDEILRGTNSLDRHTGSAALIKQLIKHNAACIIATHDIELAKMKEEYPDNILNYHFDVQVSNDELYFDYRLKEGICTSLNASILMKKIGIEL
jgi:DNA mismatch repair ATPase MutS